MCATYPAVQTDATQIARIGIGVGGGAGDKEKHLAVRDLSRLHGRGGVQLHLNEGGIVYCAHILSNTPHIAAAAGTHVCCCTRGGIMQLITTNATTRHHCTFLPYCQILVSFNISRLD